MRSVGLAELAKVLADPTRAAMCVALLDGGTWTVGALGRVAGVSPSTASEQVARLAAAGFVTTVRRGRYRHIQLASQQVAGLVEQLNKHAEQQLPTSLRDSLRASRFAFARTCYDHLAGAVGVALRDGMVRTGLIDARAGLAVTDTGRDALAELGVTLPMTTTGPVLQDCLDWTERREHLSGALPAALLTQALTCGWVSHRSDRVLQIHRTAVIPFATLGVDLEALQGADGGVKLEGPRGRDRSDSASSR